MNERKSGTVAGKRRLAAVMFTDLAGYTELSQRDEAQALRLVREQERLVRPLLAPYHGRKVKSTGDGLLIEFESAREATLFAVELQQRISERNLDPVSVPLRLRIGIHLGDVERRGTDIFGDTVNIASRIESLADPGGVFVSGPVYAQVRNKVPFDFERADGRPMKGVRDPIEIYRVAPPRARSEAGAVGPERTRIAVLPFANMSPDPNDAYFADGMTEEIISGVAGLSGLNVISRTSVMGYKGTSKRVGEIGRELNVGSLLEGSVRKAGTRLRITVQLIDAATDSHVWSQNYDRELADAFAVQSDIAQRVADTLRVSLLPDERERLERIPTRNPEAHADYLQARQHFRAFNRAGLDASLEWYRRTLAKDGGFARAYEGMAETHLFYGFLGILPEKVAYPKAKELSEKALEIDGSLSGSHYILGRILTEYYWRRDAGEAEYRRAIDLAPNNPTARLAYSWLLASRLDRDGASGEAEKAVELDPKSTEAWWSGAYTFYLLGEFDREVEYGRRAVELNPKDPIAHLLTSFGYLFSERPEDAVREAEEASSLANRQSYYQANLAGVYGFAGRKEAATRLLTQLLEFSKTEHVQAAMMAWAFASIGDLDGFFHWYQRAVDERSSYIAYMANEPSLRRAGILADPRFRRIMEQAGLSL